MSGCGTTDDSVALQITGATQEGLRYGELFHAQLSGRNVDRITVVVEAVEQGEFHEIARGWMNVGGDTNDASIYFLDMDDAKDQEDSHRFSLGGTGSLREDKSNQFPAIDYTIPAEYSLTDTSYPKQMEIEPKTGTLVYQRHYRVPKETDQAPGLIMSPSGELYMDVPPTP
ncbi:MAG: hypothetical protein IH991_00915, partial [Planctomycetes bacterium]|nr:hypothetical protein [Planctomycetota bacterium]